MDGAFLGTLQSPVSIRTGNVAMDTSSCSPPGMFDRLIRQTPYSSSLLVFIALASLLGLFLLPFLECLLSLSGVPLQRS